MSLLSERKQAVLLVVASAILWSFGGILIKYVNWHPLGIAGMRSTIALLFLLLVSRKPKWTWSVAQIGGGIAYAATMILFVVATKLTTAANAILLQYTAPIYVALFSNWFLDEKITWLDWLIIFLVMVGMSLFFLDKLTTSGFWGNILAIITGITLAWLFLFLRKQRNDSPMESLILGNILAALVGLPFMFTSIPDGASWLGLVLLGIFQLGLPYFLFSIAIKHVTAIESILIPTIEPLLNPIWVLLLMGEKPGVWAIAGGSIVLLSVTARGVVTTLHKNSPE
ncbi:EamA family transporter [candidate division KSB1 bacterium]|nr:EamA family transporter [candidate division KSB1 bacterium]